MAFIALGVIESIAFKKHLLIDIYSQGIPIVTLYSYLSILVGKISTVFLQNLEYLLTDQG